MFAGGVVRRALPVAALGALPAALTILVVRLGLSEGYLGIDFLPLRRAAKDIVAGRSPWPTPAELPALLETGTAYVYPPIAAMLAAPLALVPATAATVAWTGLLIGATLVGLRLLGVRDWRCYGATFLWGCVVSAIQTGNVTLLLVLGLAALWRLRKHAVAAALLVGFLVALKFFLWPLLVWLLASRRPRVALSALGVAASVTLLTWSLLGFEGLTAYPELLRALHRIEESESYTVLALALEAGLPRGAAVGAGAVSAVAVLVLAVILARREDEARAFTLAVASAIAFSTVVWLHYFALLVVPVAIARPRFGPLWLLPLAFWLGTGTGNGSVWETGVVMLAATATFVAVLRPPASRSEAVEAPGDPAPARAAA